MAGTQAMPTWSSITLQELEDRPRRQRGAVSNLVPGRVAPGTLEQCAVRMLRELRGQGAAHGRRVQAAHDRLPAQRLLEGSAADEVLTTESTPDGVAQGLRGGSAKRVEEFLEVTRSHDEHMTPGGKYKPHRAAADPMSLAASLTAKETELQPRGLRIWRCQRASFATAKKAPPLVSSHISSQGDMEPPNRVQVVRQLEEVGAAAHHGGRPTRGISVRDDGQRGIQEAGLQRRVADGADNRKGRRQPVGDACRIDRHGARGLQCQCGPRYITGRDLPLAFALRRRGLPLAFALREGACRWPLHCARGTSRWPLHCARPSCLSRRRSDRR